MRRAVNSDRVALDLYTRHRAALTRYARGIVSNPAYAEDVVQEAWFRLRNANDPELIRDPLSYLYRIVRNLAVDACRALARDAARSAGSVETVALNVADGQPSADQTVVARRELRVVLEALSELPERTQLAVRLNRIEGKKLREVAEQLGISIALAHGLISKGVAYCDARRQEAASKLEKPE